ncbi:MAG: RNA polymerase sigma factor (sigma-70 family), partial [Dokdonia sp.]
GDPKALSALYDRYAGALLGVLRRMCNDQGLAEDLLQETFLKIWKQAASYSPEKGKFYTWTYRIAKNTALNALRKSKPLIQDDFSSVHIEEEETVESPINRYALSGALNTLDPHHRKAIDLIYFRGYTHQEAHQAMNVPLGTFKSYVQQALKKMRKSYPKEALLLGLILAGML